MVTSATVSSGHLWVEPHGLAGWLARREARQHSCWLCKRHPSLVVSGRLWLARCPCAAGPASEAPWAAVLAWMPKSYAAWLRRRHPNDG